MQIILVAINAKYIHSNLAIRSLKANCDFPVVLKEFTIKDDVNAIVDSLRYEDPDVIGFSCYLWNIQMVRQISAAIKKTNPNVIIVYGGPETSYDFDDDLTSGCADYIIINEGEQAFNDLMHCLYHDLDVASVNNLSFIYKGDIIRTPCQNIAVLDNLKDPFDYQSDDYQNRIQYIEMSRGCPYHCAYCMASMDNNLRFYDIGRVKKQIKRLYDAGARTFKFLDRTFNIRKELALSIFQYILEHKFEGASFQFEINGEILSDNLIDYLVKRCPQHKIRFEIGIQSTNPLVNEAVNRRQNTSKLFRNIRRLNQSHVDLHLDLIAGLPHEDYQSFINTFDQTFKLYAKELQLGFLKILKGTAMQKESGRYAYRYHRLPPYEIQENQFINKEQLNNIRLVESMLDIYWNKGFMNRAIKLLTESIVSPFDFFLKLGRYFNKRDLKTHRYQLSDIFSVLEDFVGRQAHIDDIRYDYLHYHRIKPKIYWSKCTQKNDVIRAFHQHHQKYLIDDLYKYAVVMPYQSQYLIMLYFPENSISFLYQNSDA